MELLTGRIVKAISGFYYVFTAEQRVRCCRARGVFKKRGISPVVGDQVEVEPIGANEGIVVSVAQRTNQLVRPVISNVDQALLVFALVDPPLSFFQLDKMIAAIERERVAIAIAFTKGDLPGADAVFAAANAIYSAIGYPVTRLSVKQGLGLGRTELSHLLADKVTVMAGQSGVGKSTILSHLSPESGAITGAVGERSHRGRHTTTHVELFPVDSGFLADTPGFSQIDLTDLELDDLGPLFRDFVQQAPQCEFRGCLHEVEQGCEVRVAVEQQRIVRSRYTHYLQLLQELKEAKARRYS
ncbi:MAG: ribosome small subunit-dependent GTPase A [Firmicutes bacterium]|nr:ribosome small subunit-dependent GTPase A [Bacillota bacterium]